MQGDDGRVGCGAERTGRQKVASGKCAQKVYSKKVRSQSEVERSTLTHEKATHREIKDERGVRGDWLQEIAGAKRQT